MCDSAYVSETVTSQASGYPLAQGSRVIIIIIMVYSRGMKKLMKQIKLWNKH